MRKLSLKPVRLPALPTPLSRLIKPMVLVAIGLHALLLFYPLTHENKPQPKTDKKEEPVKLTQLSKTPPQNRPKRQIPKKLSRPPSPVKAPPKPPTPPGNPGAQSADILADFPHYPGAQPDCFGKTGDSCRFTNANIASVVSHFKKALTASKFKIDEASAGSQGETFFKVSKGNQSFYVSVLSDSPITVYFLTSDQIDKAKLAKIKAGAVAQIPQELTALLDAVAPAASGGAATLDATPSDLDSANASFFFQPDPDSPLNQVTLPGIQGARIAEGRSDADIVAEAKSKFERVTPVGTYGGGNLYEIKKGSFTGYLSVVQGKTGIIVVTWLQKPS